MIDRLRAAIRGYRALDDRVWKLALVRAVNTGGLSLVMVFMGVYLVTERDLSMTAYGGITLLAQIGQSWAQGSAGMLSDRVGRRPVMAVALAVRSVVIAGLGSLVLVAAPIWVIACVLIISSSLRGVFEPVAYAFVADVVEDKDRVVAFGLQRMGTNLGWAIGPATGGALAVYLSYGVVFFAAAPLLLVSALLVMRLREPQRRESRGERTSVFAAVREAVSELDAALFFAGAFLFAVCHVQLFSTLAVFGKGTLGLTEAALGRGYAVNGVLVLALQLPAVALIARFGNRRSMIAGSLLYVAAFLAFGQAGALAGIIAAISLLTVGEVIIAPAQQAVVAELADAESYGRAFGVMGTIQMLGVAIAPLCGGLAYDHLGTNGAEMWAALGAFPALMTVVFIWFAAVRARRLERAA